MLNLALILLLAQPAERLDRGLIAVPTADGTHVSWRLLPGDAPDRAFVVERGPTGGPFEVVARLAGDQPTSWIDASQRPAVYRLVGEPGVAARWPEPYWTVPVDCPPGYRPNDASVGDLDGDGALEIVLHLAGAGRDNSQSGVTDPPILDAYRLDGTRLWRINLGRNVREGAHYTQFMVFDLDGDGRAEVACRTADGTVDGTGAVLGDAAADQRNAAGYILTGPEYLTVFDGRTGAVRDSVDYVPARGEVRAWGDDYGNRVDRFLACVAYLDGERPSLVFCRGYYTRAVLAAWDLADSRLRPRWVFDTNADAALAGYRGQGNHNLAVGDVDGDGRDEIVYGAAVIDDDGTGLYTTGLGHGDALHLADIDPDRPGLEIFSIHEKPRHPHGAELRDAATGALLWSLASPDVGRGVAMDIDPRHHGYECWAAGGGLAGLQNARGETISRVRPRSCNFGVWWDGDPLRELLDGIVISNWDPATETESILLRADGCVAINGTKANPSLCADILGDHREEVIWPTADGTALRIYATPHAATERRVALLADRQYRLSVAWQNVGYNQPTQTSYYLGAP